jgi:restriction endonuclease S subunit
MYIYYLFEDYKMSNLVDITSSYPTIRIPDIENFKIPDIKSALQETIVKNIMSNELQNVPNIKAKKAQILKKYLL